MEAPQYASFAGSENLAKGMEGHPGGWETIQV